MDREVLQGILDRSPVDEDGRAGSVPKRVVWPVLPGSWSSTSTRRSIWSKRERTALPWWLRQEGMALGTGLV
jgi:hypothetical protein